MQGYGIGNYNGRALGYLGALEVQPMTATEWVQVPVRQLQCALNTAGYRDEDNRRLTVDGSFGDKTRWAMDTFRRSRLPGRYAYVGSPDGATQLTVLREAVEILASLAPSCGLRPGGGSGTTPRPPAPPSTPPPAPGEKPPSTRPPSTTSELKTSWPDQEPGEKTIVEELTETFEPILGRTRRRRPLWPWALGGLGLLAAILAAVAYARRKRERRAAPMASNRRRRRRRR